MINILRAQFEDLRNSVSGKWAERIMAQIAYAMKLSEGKQGKFDSIIEKTIKYLYEKYEADGVIGKATAFKAEEILSEMSQEAKRLSIVCVAHAHIDMNWMWGMAETVAVTLDTFRTMLDLMKEYPEFKFSQSQASVYNIVEEYDPEMLKEIKSRVHEGRWEVTASTWVETDKNMPNGESLARHILYTKRYLANLLDISPDGLNLDFEPDTFGHSANVPEILQKGGVKYYYHCRGYVGNNIYRWKAPSGSTVLVYREPFWYNETINNDIVLQIPEFCMKHGLDTVLKVYGVGDHGGGPTRRDIEKLIEMSGWPVFPTIRLGTFGEFFSLLDKVSDRFPIVDRELNFIFTGCYTTQARIKQSNKMGEARLNKAELFGAFSANYVKGDYSFKSYEAAWRKLLFNQFHDILPGSGVIETREYAMGQSQQVFAVANTVLSKALRNVASQIDTSSLPVYEDGLRDSISEGAGVGYSVNDYGLPQTERGVGKGRIIHFFNPSLHDRTEPVELTIWDWPGDMNRMQITDIDGKAADFQILTGKSQQLEVKDFWGHKYINLLVNTKIPACGYSTYVLNESNDFKPVIMEDLYRVEKSENYILENDNIKAVFDSCNMSLISLTDKKASVEMIRPDRPSCIFRVIDEDDSKGMTAWIVGRYMNIAELNKDVKPGKVLIDSNSLRQFITYGIKFRGSSLDVMISLDKNSSRLDFNVECDWQERAVKGSSVPQLNFYAPFEYICSSYKYDIPFGTIQRESLNNDVPANSWGLGVPGKKVGSALMLISNSKYGFRGTEDSLSLNLLRSSYDPDPYPENGVHKFRFAVDIVQNHMDNKILIDKAYDFCHPVSFISGRKHDGSLPLEGSFLKLIKGTVAVSTVKLPEDCNSNKQMLIRLYETSGENTKTAFKLPHNVSKAWFTDINENELSDGGIIDISGDYIEFEVHANSIVNVIIEH